MTLKLLDIRELLREACEEFHREYDRYPDIAGVAPGRVNLIGEHTDYNDGFVFPMALPMVTIVLGSKNDGETCRVRTLLANADEPRKIEFAVPTEEDPLRRSTPNWANYVKGVVQYFNGEVVGFDALVISSVPSGGGLSSSAALEVATFTFLEGLTGCTTNMKEKALLCQKAEHNFANVPCGVMDQLISVYGKEGCASLIDCRSLEVTNVQIPSSDCVFLITNSKVSHELGSSEYAVRRKTCEDVSKKLKKKALRDVSMIELENLKNSGNIDQTSFRRARHVIKETERTLNAVKALQHGSLEEFGNLMNESHESLRDDYEVSCKELDLLVDTARKVDGVYGSRMTGGGFGGCTITMAKESAVDQVIRSIERTYSRKADFYIVHPSLGARIMYPNEK